jgi:glycosyltransferase involved in cell wall biosynthesis
MRIGLDVRYLSHGLVGGVRTYVAQFIANLVELAVDDEIVLYADTKAPFELQDLPSSVTVRLLPWSGPQSSVYYDLQMKKAMAQDNLDLVHFTGNYGFGPSGIPCVITLQDEINLLPLADIIRGHPKHPRVMMMMTYLHIMTKAAIRRADLVITVSDYSRRQILRYSRIDRQRIVAIHHACPSDISAVRDPVRLTDVRDRLDLHGSFILAEAFKNPAVLIRAWYRLPEKLRNQYHIVFFSRSPDVLPVVHEAIDAGFARLLIRPDRRDLSALYSMAAVFVFPSWIEGFGIPLVEAMTCGAPIIASDRGSIPEIVGDAARIIDAEDDCDLARHLSILLTDPEAAMDLRTRGFARAAHFSWKENVRQVLSLYQQLRNTQALQFGKHLQYPR